jgi:hypothetical protein
MTSENLLRLYQRFCEIEVTFNSQVIMESGLSTSDVHLSIGSHHLPCVLYACSMKGARVIAEIGQNLVDPLAHRNPGIGLSLGFKQKDEVAAVILRMSCRVETVSDYGAREQQVRFISLEFSQKPSDLLIGVLGSLLEIKSNELRRRDQRIILNPENMKKIGLESRESCLAIEGASRRCLVRDLSFGGAKVLLSSVKFPRGSGKVLFKLQKCEVQDDAVLSGSIVRVEDVEGRRDLVALSIQYSTEPPISYKQKINNAFFSP